MSRLSQAPTLPRHARRETASPFSRPITQFVYEFFGFGKPKLVMFPHEADRINSPACGHKFKDAVFNEPLVVSAHGAPDQFRDGFQFLLIPFTRLVIAGHRNGAVVRRDCKAKGRRELYMTCLDHDLPDIAEKNGSALPAEYSRALPRKRSLPDIETERRKLIHETHSEQHDADSRQDPK